MEYLFNLKDNSQIIRNYNTLIWELSRTNNPDLIIIAIPGEILPFSKKVFANFGLKAYLLSLGITPDYTIYNVCYGTYNKEFFKEFNNIFLYRFGFEINDWYMTNKLFDWPESEESNDIILRSLYLETYNKKLKENKEKKLIFKTLEQISKKVLYTLTEENIIEFV